MILTGTFDGKEILIDFNGEGKPCSLHVRFLAPINMDVDRGVFSNPRMLSAQLRSELNYRDCCVLLSSHNIPTDSGLWALNHDGYPGDEYIQKLG